MLRSAAGSGLQRGAALLTLALVAAGCSGPPDIRTPEGALARIFAAYHDSDAAAVYALTSRRTHELVGEAWTGMRKLRSRIEQELPLGAREEALNTSGVDLLRGVESEEGLFARIVQLPSLQVGSSEVFGGQVRKSEIDEAKATAVLTTEAGQTFELVREEDGVWRSRHLEEDLDRRLGALRDNLKRFEDHARAVQERDDQVQQLLGKKGEPGSERGTGAAASGTGAADQAGAAPASGAPAAQAAAPAPASKLSAERPTRKAKRGKKPARRR